MIRQQFNSKQLNEAQANSIPKSVVRSASLQRFNNSNNHNKENLPHKNKGIQLINNYENLSKVLQEKINPFNELNQAKIQKTNSCINTRNHIVNKLLEKSSNQASKQIKPQTKKCSNKITTTNTQIQNTTPNSNPNCISNFYHKHQNIQKLLSLKEQKQQFELKECTFNPHTNTRTNNLIQKKVDVKNFYQQQTLFLKKKQDKIQQMRLIIEKNKNKENIFHPQITHRESSRNKIEVYQRLYQRPTQNQNQQSTSIALTGQNERSCRNTSNNKKNNSTHKIKSIMTKNQCSSGKNIKCFSQMNIPLGNQTEHIKKSSISRPNSLKKVSQFQHQKGIVSNKQQSCSSKSLLKRIQQSKNLDCQQFLRKNKLKQQQKLIQERKAFTQKNKNQEIFISKFIKEVIRIIIKTNVQYYLNYMQLSNLLQNLNFIDKNCANNDRTFVSQIWRLLNGQTYDFVTILNVIKVLCCIEGATKPKLIDQLIDRFLIKSSLNEIQKLIPSKIEHILVLEESDPKTIKQRFKQLCLNRVRLGQSFLLKQNLKQEHSFKPIISEISSELAERYRQRILQQSQQLLNQNKIDFNIPQGGYINHTQLLLLDQKRRAHRLKQMRQQKNKQQQTLLQQSTIQHKSSFMKTQMSEMQKKKQQSCFQQPSSIYSIKKQNDKSINSFQKDQKKFSQNHSKNQNSYSQILDEQDNKLSLRQVQKQPLKTTKKQQIQANCPLLYLNVNMQGNQNTKIPVFKNDTLKTMTEKVRVIMKIQDGEQERNKLSNILRAQIQPILIKMGLQNSIQII